MSKRITTIDGACSLALSPEAVEHQDYREVDGVKVPFIIHQIEDVHFTTKLTEVKHNGTIDDSVFVKTKK